MKKVFAQIFSVFMALSISVAASAAVGEADGLAVSGLKVNNLVAPLGIDTRATFRWQNNSSGYGKAQSGYQIIVSSSREKAAALEGDLCDTGKQTGANNYDIGYRGKELASRSDYYWRVRVWDEDDTPSEWSEIASFSTGVLSQKEWSGEWIGAKRVSKIGLDLSGANWIWSRYGKAYDKVPVGSQYFRGEFSIDPQKSVEKVYLGMSTDDHGSAYINGQLARVIANTGYAWREGALLEVTKFVKPGHNILAAKVTNESEGYAGFIAKVEVRYTDGSKDVVVSDGSWKVAQTPASGWKDENFDDSAWGAPDQVLKFGAAESVWGNQVNLKADGDQQSAPMLRKTFEVAKKVALARAYVCGLGLFEMKLNGQLVDDTVLNPAHTQYEDTVNYRVFDVTRFLEDGKNAIAVELGESFYHNDVAVWDWQIAVWRDYPKLLLELDIRYADGSSERIVTDPSWKIYTEGPITSNNIMRGESYDARLEIPNWEEADFDDSGWEAAHRVAAPSGRLTFENMEPMRRIQTFSPKVTDLGQGTYVIKNPVMTSGWAKIRFDAPKGTEITITYGETLQSDGSLKKPTDFGIIFQIDHYICKGEAGETYEPKFGYKGYEYIQVENYPGKLRAENVECYWIANDVEHIAEFETSSEKINLLHEAMRRTIQNNMHGKPTDTPIWEKNGWTGDFNVSLETINFNFDTTCFNTKFIKDLSDAAAESGAVPLIAPTANWGMDNSVVWNGAFINAIYEGWRSFGLRSVMEQYYGAMRKQAMLYISDIGKNGWVWYDGQLSDWVAPSGGSDPKVGIVPNPSEGSGICGTGYVYDLLRRMGEMAEELGKDADGAEYRDAMVKIYDAFNAKYYRAEKGYYETTVWDGSQSRSRYRQTSNLVPLAFGLCPEKYRARVVASLVKDIEGKGYHLDTGAVGTKFLLPVLSDSGYAEVAMKILLQETYPSWGYWIAQGSSSTWESYEDTARSHDHYFLGTYDEWFFKHLVGIQDMRDGYRRVTLKPEIFESLTSARCSLRTVRGILESCWSLTHEDTLRMEVTIPIGTEASIYLPVSKAEGVQVNGKKLHEQAGIQGVSVESGMVKVTAGSGRYSFAMSSEEVGLSRVGEVAR